MTKKGFKKKKEATGSTNRNVRGRESSERWPSQSIHQLAGWFSAGRRGCPRQAFISHPPFRAFCPLALFSLPLRRTFCATRISLSLPLTCM